MLQRVLTHVVAHPVGVPPGPAEQVLHAVRTCLPGPLGNRPAVFAGRSDSSPSPKPRTRRRGSTRPNRPAIRPIRTSNVSCRRAGSTLRPAATARSSVFTHR
ncbi:hypothetical protein ACF07V_38235 [Streptomyces sp. NPDC015661]|uniref:hypothetical protein n=1 Tax=Streptomyces sp. NPDC015661 TaxID=3364961 RepID=UPI0036FB9163